MKPSAFRYVRPPDVAAALRALRDDPDAKVIAGGQSLVPMMNLRLARPDALIDIDRMDGLARVFEDVDSLIIGALVRHRRLERDPLVAARAPLLREAARHIGHVGIRNRGTLGGTLAHADPAAELPLVMVALGATVHVESLDRGRREIPAADFFASLYTTALAEDELVTWVRVPAMAPRQGWGFAEFSRRPGDFAMAGAAALITVTPTGRVTQARAALMGIADRPLLLPDTTVDQPPDPPAGTTAVHPPPNLEAANPAGPTAGRHETANPGEPTGPSTPKPPGEAGTPRPSAAAGWTGEAVALPAPEPLDEDAAPRPPSPPASGGARAAHGAPGESSRPPAPKPPGEGGAPCSCPVREGGGDGVLPSVPESSGGGGGPRSFPAPEGGGNAIPPSHSESTGPGGASRPLPSPARGRDTVFPPAPESPAEGGAPCLPSSPAPEGGGVVRGAAGGGVLSAGSESPDGGGALRSFARPVVGGGGDAEAWGEVARLWTAGLGIEDAYTRRLARVALARALRDAHRRALAAREGERA